MLYTLMDPTGKRVLSLRNKQLWPPAQKVNVTLDETWSFLIGSWFGRRGLLLFIMHRTFSVTLSRLPLSFTLSPPRAMMSSRHTHQLPYFKCTLPVSEKLKRVLLIFSKAFIIDSLRDKLLKIISYSQTLFVFIEKPRVLRAGRCRSHYLWC